MIDGSKLKCSGVLHRKGLLILVCTCIYVWCVVYGVWNDDMMILLMRGRGRFGFFKFQSVTDVSLIR